MTERHGSRVVWGRGILALRRLRILALRCLRIGVLIMLRRRVCSLAPVHHARQRLLTFMQGGNSRVHVSGELWREGDRDLRRWGAEPVISTLQLLTRAV